MGRRLLKILWREGGTKERGGTLWVVAKIDESGKQSDGGTPTGLLPLNALVRNHARARRPAHSGRASP